MPKSFVTYYLIGISALFAFLASYFAIVEPYSVLQLMLIFVFNLGTSYVAYLLWQSIDRKLAVGGLDQERKFAVFSSIALIAIPLLYSIVYPAFIFLLVGWDINVTKSVILGSSFSVALGAGILFFMLTGKISTIKQKDNSLDYILKSQQIMEIEILKYQIDPHFIFNAFNTLLFLINDDPPKAYKFCEKLAKVYRYVIFSQHKNLVLLKEEFEFAMDYSYLQEIRHSNEISIQFNKFESAHDRLIIPVSIQILIENAIKHNRFSEAEPLTINIELNDEYISVKNPIRDKAFKNQESSKIGLRNLFERSKLIVGKECFIKQDDQMFQVFVPILKT